ncbi:hypothetical protein PoB_000559800 [Plakobranchus ocellatus]|uniref:Uncharacterized protein n=1 Tax=Plakobranchus ocellatus TaxID=259542 RepID=A0AAV3Y9G6_9GAST|nr:hypothetical protein PoB_000559800 [Plakobranchus ocellatus]
MISYCSSGTDTSLDLCMKRHSGRTARGCLLRRRAQFLVRQGQSRRRALDPTWLHDFRGTMAPRGEWPSNITQDGLHVTWTNTLYLSP